jgi:hypothetical protein
MAEFTHAEQHRRQQRLRQPAPIVRRLDRNVVHHAAEARRVVIGEPGGGRGDRGAFRIADEVHTISQHVLVDAAVANPVAAFKPVLADVVRRVVPQPPLGILPDGVVGALVLLRALAVPCGRQAADSVSVKPDPCVRGQPRRVSASTDTSGQGQTEAHRDRSISLWQDLEGTGPSV